MFTIIICLILKSIITNIFAKIATLDPSSNSRASLSTSASTTLVEKYSRVLQTLRRTKMMGNLGGNFVCEKSQYETLISDMNLGVETGSKKKQRDVEFGCGGKLQERAG